MTDQKHDLRNTIRSEASADAELEIGSAPFPRAEKNPAIVSPPTDTKAPSRLNAWPPDRQTRKRRRTCVRAPCSFRQEFSS
jgi:hypothetical protein